MARTTKPRRYVLTDEQRHMYASEKLMNFRWISKILATYSPYTLSSKDLAPPAIQTYLSEVGQFAEVAYSALPSTIQFLFANLPTLLEPPFPLEGYESLRGASLVSAFTGTTARLPAFVALRPLEGGGKQLIAAFSGTATALQALHDVRALPHRHPARRGRVHAGFWALYMGVREQALAAIRRGLADTGEGEVRELVLTGHSMGGAVAQLLLLDILRDPTLLPALHTPLLPPLHTPLHTPTSIIPTNTTTTAPAPTPIPIRLVVFGAPRSATSPLARYYASLLAARRASHGPDSILEYSVKTWRDGVPALPPRSFGYRHYAERPLYWVHGRLYWVPSTEREHTLFHVAGDEEKDAKEDAKEADAKDADTGPLHPRGGHNYYNGRDMEKLVRRVLWLDKAVKRAQQQAGGADGEGGAQGDWRERYRALVLKHEHVKR
ncbi:Alpha/Beta hydrolase protein [Mycena filopes]|nr:Alpha/Beta hydrolase protein [Mycena filopes]